MRKAKFGTILLTSILISGAVPLTALADTAIDRVSLEISSDIVPGDDSKDVDVSTSSSRYDVDDVEVTNKPSGDWDEGDEPKIRVTLKAENNYYFKSGFSKSDVDLSGDDAEVTSVSRSRDELRVSIRLAELELAEKLDVTIGTIGYYERGAGQIKAVEYVENLVLTGRYKKCPASGLGVKEA